MTFLYFVPDDLRGTITWDMLPEPLRTILAGASLDCKRLQSGPGGGSGLLFAPIPADPDGRQADVNYHPANQQWDDHGVYWLGGVNDALPTPADLRRVRKPVEGRLFTLGDGAEWLLPAVGPFHSKLPHVLRSRWNDAKHEEEARVVVVERYKALADESMQMAEWCAGNIQLPWLRLLRFIADSLALNYHVGLAEVGVLGLVDTSLHEEAIEALVGLTDYKEQLAAKKEE